MMIQKYPVGLQDFEKIRSEDYLYVDKTEFVHKLANYGGYYFLSRPRRFGKSLLISTLECLFQGKKELFEGLYVEDKWEWEKTYPVIRMSFSNIGHRELGLSIAINNRLDEIANDYEIELKNTSISQKFKELIESLSATLGKVVVLIDEYDKPIIDYLGVDTEKAQENRDIMKSFYSILKDADPHLKLVFITGVSKFARVSIFSDLNNLTDITMDWHFGAICGITEEELRKNFSQELEEYDLKEIREWYNGYNWDRRVSVYNPFSLLHFFRSGEFTNYWFETGIPTFIINLAKDYQMYDFDDYTIGANGLSAYNIEKLELIPLMFQTGYLTIKSYDPIGLVYTLTYPNKEVKVSYLDSLMSAYSNKDLGASVPMVYKLNEALEKGEINKLQSILNTLFKSLPYELWQKENEHFYHAIMHISFSLLGVFIQSEIQTSDGRMDALVQNKDYIYCFEFKLDESADTAIQQVKEKGYLEPFAHDSRKKIGIGVNFSKELKKVAELKWEEMGN